MNLNLPVAAPSPFFATREGVDKTHSVVLGASEDRSSTERSRVEKAEPRMPGNRRAAAAGHGYYYQLRVTANYP